MLVSKIFSSVQRWWLEKNTIRSKSSSRETNILNEKLLLLGRNEKRQMKKERVANVIYVRS